MKYLAPSTLPEAYRALRVDGAACLAGGQSLVAMMNLGLAAPDVLVSLRDVSELRGIEALPDGGLRIGAMTTHAEIARLDTAAPGPALIVRTARQIAYPAVRTRGTLGGSVSLADPSADYPVALCAADAVIELGSVDGVREVNARDFFLGIFETAREVHEIVLAVRIPAGPVGAGVAYEKLSLVTGDFAIVSVAVLGKQRLDIAVGSCGPAPLLAKDVEASADGLREAGRQLALMACDAPDDQRASAAYRQRVLPRLVERAGRQAIAEIRHD